jgi:hypothetical protein
LLAGGNNRGVSEVMIEHHEAAVESNGAIFPLAASS